MSTVNVIARELAAKVVFYGPGLSGKTTSLKRIYDTVKPAHRGELMSLPTEADRTLFFDFLPVKVERVGDFSVRLALYTVPGQVFYNATRKLVLQGADGVVFVADSQAAAEDSNLESMRNLEENLAEQGVRIERFPLVLQYNKRDTPTAVSVERLRELLNPRGVPDFETCATSGQGILDALKAIMRLVIRDLRGKKVVPPARPSSPKPASPAKSAPEPAVAGLETQIQQHLETGAAAELGPAGALAPGVLLDVAKVADQTFRAREYVDCVRACAEGLKRALAFAGDGPPGAQAYLLGVDGRDVLQLLALASREHARMDDAAFGLSVLMQALVRLSAAGLPHPAE